MEVAFPVTTFRQTPRGRSCARCWALGSTPREELAEDLTTLFTHICHAVQIGTTVRTRSLRFRRPTWYRFAVRRWLVLEAGHHRDALGFWLRHCIVAALSEFRRRKVAYLRVIAGAPIRRARAR